MNTEIGQKCEKCGCNMEPPVSSKLGSLIITVQEQAYLCHRHGYTLTTGEFVGWSLNSY